jgi:hypothetical protein
MRGDHTALVKGISTTDERKPEMVRALGPDGQQLPFVVASHKATWRGQRDLRVDDLEFDGGIGDFNVCLDVTNRRTVCPTRRERGITDCIQTPIFPDTPICRDGVIACAKGRNPYLPGSLYEAEPEVRAYWLTCVSECIAAGVDGLDVRISNHSSWTDRPDLYGFNEPILAEYARRHGGNPDREPYDLLRLAAIRGDVYEAFLRAAKRRLSVAGKKLQLHLEVESFRPDAPWLDDVRLAPLAAVRPRRRGDADGRWLVAGSHPRRRARSGDDPLVQPGRAADLPAQLHPPGCPHREPLDSRMSRSTGKPPAPTDC